MVLYYCSDKHEGWPDFACSFIGQPLSKDDILFIHWTDFNPDGREQKAIVKEVFVRGNVSVCHNLVFFSGNVAEISEETISQKFSTWFANALDGGAVFKYPQNVEKDITGKFGEYFKAFVNGIPPSRPCAWFDPQLGEMKNAFRLLTQVWLMATDQAGDHDDGDGNLKGMIKKQWEVLKDGFWKPVASDADGKVLHDKLLKAHRTDGEPDWKRIDLANLNASELRAWAFSDKQSV